ncbi:MAG TPA: maleylpyruvate isomerase family mycothiol-dependent enzyme [Chloroflexota bacterium]|jgi:uncharacterized protein (TIGR03083 family)
MASHADVDASIRHIRAETERLRATLASLPAEAWDTPSNCPPWPVRRLVAHIVNNAEFIQTNVERGAAGITVSGIDPEARAKRVQYIAGAPPAEVVTILDQTTADLEAAFERLSPEQVEAICYHPAGNRPARWYAQQRLAEVAFHQWDVLHSLGRDPALDPAVAGYLLPMLLESNLPRTYQRGPKGDGRFRLVAQDAPDQAWLLTATPERLQVQRGGDGAACTITAPAGILALLVYGRANLAAEEQRGRARVEGDRALADRFHTIFPGP